MDERRRRDLIIKYSQCWKASGDILNLVMETGWPNEYKKWMFDCKIDLTKIHEEIGVILDELQKKPR